MTRLSSGYNSICSSSSHQLQWGTCMLEWNGRCFPCVRSHMSRCRNSLLTASAVKKLLRLSVHLRVIVFLSIFLPEHPYQSSSWPIPLLYQRLSVILLVCPDRKNNQTKVTQDEVYFVKTLECCHYRVFDGWYVHWTSCLPIWKPLLHCFLIVSAWDFHFPVSPMPGH